jgi:hypothetical protein
MKMVLKNSLVDDEPDVSALKISENYNPSWGKITSIAIEMNTRKMSLRQQTILCSGRNSERSKGYQAANRPPDILLSISRIKRIVMYMFFETFATAESGMIALFCCSEVR